VESKQQELTSAQAAVDASDANLQSARQEVVRLKADQDALRQQRNNLRLVAPVDGVLTSRDAEAGSTVVAGQSVLKLIEPSSLWVKVRLDQGRSRGLAAGQAASIALRSNPGMPLTGKVVRIEPVSDSVTEERITLITFDQIPPGLSIGEMAEVTVQTAANQSGLTLPNAAIKQMPEGSGVWKLRDGKPVFVAIKLGTSTLDGAVQVLEGLGAGDEIIVFSERELSEGSRVKVVEQLAGQRK
ncbi:MAG: efflux RND transporter periplasmic adaptor subunit, partial [Dechloromonas sp.]|nr:efflux RND transporter periplasmic adaptor subunit [Dechloromonas sp.]